MRSIAVLSSLVFLSLVAEASPKIEVFGGCKRSVTVALTNCDTEPYYYHSMFVNDLPYVIEVQQDGQTRTISDNYCGTGARWNRLEPKSSICVEIRLIPEAKLPTAKAVLLIYDSDNDRRRLIGGATVEMTDAIQFLRKTGLDKADEPSVSCESFVGDKKSDDQPLKTNAEKRANPESCNHAKP